MIALDTNVLVRFLIADDPEQAERARRLIQTNTVFVPNTVLLETYWVLKSAYSLGPKNAYEVIRSFVGLENVALEDRAAIDSTFEACASGVDFADALHVSSSGSAIEFATFDRQLVRAWTDVVTPIKVVTL